MNGNVSTQLNPQSPQSAADSPLKKGYKRTEVGVIPEDWEVKQLRDISNISTGNTPPTNDPSNYGDDHPFVGPIDIGYSKFITNTEKRLSERGFSNARRFPQGTVLFVSIGSTIGKCGIAPVEVSANQQINGVFPSDTVSQDYLYYAIARLAHKIKEQAGEQAVPIVNKTQFSNTEIPLPPTKAEQEAIAEALSDADEWIASLEELIAKKHLIKQGAMQVLLTGKRRLPGFSGKWVKRRLGDCLLAPPDYGINAPAVPYSDSLATYIRITDISDDGQFSPSPRVSVRADRADAYGLSEGDVLFARTGASVGKSYLYRRRDGELVFAGFLIRVQPNPGILLPSFLSAYTATHDYWKWVRLMSMRSGQPGINGNEYAQLTLPLPPISEQTTIATVLSDMDAEIDALEAKLAKARQIKQGMMQELLAGRKRLI